MGFEKNMNHFFKIKSWFLYLKIQNDKTCVCM